MKTQRELEIDAYIEQNADAKLPAPLPVRYKGELHKVPVFRLPIKNLIFNIGNGRFAAELQAEEKKLNRSLDATKSEDAKVIRRLLLEQNEHETEVLRDDLRKNGQLDPGIITFDGAVINANRRMAILQALHDDTEDEKFEYLNVARLPHGVGEKDLWKIEAKLQFGRDFRLEYGPINELLKIRTGRHSGLSEKQISDALAGRYSAKDIIEKLEILKLIETYLNFIAKPNEYKIIQEERLVEKFNSLQGNVISSLKRGSLKGEVPKITEIGFAMIKGDKHSHWKIRRLREIAELDQARQTLYKVFGPHQKLTEDSQVIGDAFDAAEFIVDAQKEKERPEKLAGKALSALKEIDSKHISLKKQAFQKLIADIRAELERLSGKEPKKRDKGSNKN